MIVESPRERTSRFVVAVEAGLLLLPTTLLCLYGLYLCLLMGFHDSSGSFLKFGFAILIALAALANGWRLVLGFIRHGRERLAQYSAAMWVLPFAIAVVTVLGIWATWTNGDTAVALRPTFGMFYFGAPALIPLIHIAVERWVAGRVPLASSATE